MEKQFCIALRETREKIITVLNGSGLPIDVMDMLLGDIKMSVHAQAESEYQTALKMSEEKKNGSK